MDTDGSVPAGLAETLVAANFGVRDGALTVGGLPVAEIAEAYGTPLYIYDAGLLRAAYRRLAAAVAGFAEVYYSIKANPNPAVAAVFVGEGAGLEIASAAEFDSAIAAGVAPHRILFAGPGRATPTSLTSSPAGSARSTSNPNWRRTGCRGSPKGSAAWSTWRSASTRSRPGRAGQC